VAAVAHLGSGAGGGHYTVFRLCRPRGPLGPLAGAEEEGGSQEGRWGSQEAQEEEGRWFCCSDWSVEAVSEREVLRCEASLLLYELEG
jgi:hypothetical protein